MPVPAAAGIGTGHLPHPDGQNRGQMFCRPASDAMPVASDAIAVALHAVGQTIHWLTICLYL